jgi:hypothetical protein
MIFLIYHCCCQRVAWRLQIFCTMPLAKAAPLSDQCGKQSPITARDQETPLHPMFPIRNVLHFISKLLQTVAEREYYLWKMSRKEAWDRCLFFKNKHHVLKVRTFLLFMHYPYSRRSQHDRSQMYKVEVKKTHFSLL